MTQQTMDEMAAQGMLWAPDPHQGPSQVGRVLFVNYNASNGKYEVVGDFNPLNYGPSPADQNAMHIVPD